MARSTTKSTTRTGTTRRSSTSASKAGSSKAAASARRSARSTTSAATRSAPARRASAATRQAGRQAESKAEQAQQQATSALRGQLDERSNQFGEQLAGTASDVRQIAGQLRTQDNDSAAHLADVAAERIDQAAQYLMSTGSDALLGDIEDFARSKPWLAAGAAAVAGFAASRALSASRRKRHGGDYVDLDAGSEFDEADAASVYPDEPVRAGSPR